MKWLDGMKTKKFSTTKYFKRKNFLPGNRELRARTEYRSDPCPERASELRMPLDLHPAPEFPLHLFVLGHTSILNPRTTEGASLRTPILAAIPFSFREQNPCPRAPGNVCLVPQALGLQFPSASGLFKKPAWHIRWERSPIHDISFRESQGVAAFRRISDSGKGSGPFRLPSLWGHLVLGRIPLFFQPARISLKEARPLWRNADVVLSSPPPS